MTATVGAEHGARTSRTSASPGAAFTRVVTTSLEYAMAKASGGGARQQAGIKGVQAGLRGKNPVWAAIKGAWSGGGEMVKAAIVAAVVATLLLLLLSPVLLLVFLLSLLVVAAVEKVRSAER